MAMAGPYSLSALATVEGIIMATMAATTAVTMVVTTVAGEFTRTGIIDARGLEKRRVNLPFLEIEGQAPRCCGRGSVHPIGSG